MTTTKKKLLSNVYDVTNEEIKVDKKNKIQKEI